MKKLLFIALLCFLFSGQTDYETWKKKQMQAQEEFISQQDKSFANYLESHWEAYEMKQAIPLDTEPKPKKVPVIEEQKINKVTDTKTVIDTIAIPQLEMQEEIKEEMEVAPDETTITFWGLNLSFDLSQIANLAQPTENFNEKFIADCWYKMSNSKHQNLLEKMQNYRRKMRLDDWGYYQLVRTTSEKVFPENYSLQNIFTWFFLVKSGFDAKVSFAEEAVFLMLPSGQNLYGIAFLTIENRKYYLFYHDFANKQMKLFSYDKTYPDADDVINMRADQTPEIPRNLLQRNVEFTYQNVTYSLTLDYDRNLSSTKENYPQTELDIYFQSPFSDALLVSIAQEFSKIVVGKPQSVALDMILRFVQTAFPYKTDDEQFGKEKVMFPDEFLYYEYSDCEDRSIFFSALVKSILQVDVIGLDYPGHIATAVHLQEHIKGDSIELNGRKYIICDPTYINASIGMTMPKYKTIQPEIILF